MNILLINGANQYGFNLINHLLKKDTLNKILSIDNIIDESNIKYALYVNDERYSFYRGNILNEGFVHVKLDYVIKELFDEKIDYVIFISDYYNYKNSPSLLFFDTCTIGIKNVCYLSTKYNSKFIYVYDQEELNNTYINGNNMSNKYINSYKEYCNLNNINFELNILNKNDILVKIFDKE